MVKSDEAGRRIVLLSRRLGSIDRGSLIYYQGIRAGEVLGYELANDYQSLSRLSRRMTTTRASSKSLRISRT